MEIASAIAAFFEFLVLIFGKIFQMQADKKAADAKWQLNRDVFLKAATDAIAEMREKAKKDTADLGDTWDQADAAAKAAKKKNEPPPSIL